MKIRKKFAIILLNIIVIVLIIFLQGIRYSEIIEYSVETHNNMETFTNVGLLHAFGNDINIIVAVTLILLVLNLILYKKWIKAKRWIIEPLIIFIVTIGLSISYQIKRVNQVKEEYRISVEDRSKE